MNMGGAHLQGPAGQPDADAGYAGRGDSRPQWFTNLLMKYGPAGILSYTDDQSLQSQLSGRPTCGPTR